MSPLRIARAAGACWLVTFLAGSLALALGRGSASSVANLVASVSYIGATLFIAALLAPVNTPVAYLAAGFGLVGCAVSLFRLAPVILVRDLAFFGVQCLLIGYLIFRSTFLPRVLGVLMAIAGVGWLTFVWPSLAAALAPYNLIPGIIGEGVLIVWLLVKGVK